MVDDHSERLDAVFHALADPTRRAMLQRLAQGELSVGELAEPFRMTLAAASKHIKSLERAGLIERTVQGRSHLCRLQAAPLHGGYEWLRHYERFWYQRLVLLEALLRVDDRQRGADAVLASASAPPPATRRKPRTRG